MIMLSRINKDFLKLVLSGRKKLLKLSEVKRVHVPFYDELSVAHMMKDMANDAMFMMYLPDKLPKGRNCDRTYFFDILNTVHEQFLKALIEHASLQRN